MRELQESVCWFCLLSGYLERLGDENERRGNQGDYANRVETIHERQEVGMCLQLRVNIRVRLS